MLPSSVYACYHNENNNSNSNSSGALTDSQGGVAADDSRVSERHDVTLHRRCYGVAEGQRHICLSQTNSVGDPLPEATGQECTLKDITE